jgi:hypothetical protein
MKTDLTMAAQRMPGLAIRFPGSAVRPADFFRSAEHEQDRVMG